jgi:nucleoside-diphosphate-sugar epimerase
VPRPAASASCGGRIVFVSLIDAGGKSSGSADAAPSQLSCRFVTVVRVYVAATAIVKTRGIRADEQRGDMKIFITGATGYIGGSIATKLLEAGHALSGLARSDQAATALDKRGIEPVRGSLQDHGTLRRAAASVDAVINCASADNAFVVHGLLPPLYGTGKTFIQTSGSSVVGTYDEGAFRGAVFHEDTPFRPEPEKATRVAIDESALAASLKGVRSVVIRPSLIYGRGIGVDGISVQVPRLIEAAQKSGIPRHIGPGENVWAHVHIADVVSLYLAALEKAPAGSLFYGAAGEASFKALAQAIGRMLGLGERTEDWPIAEAVEALGPGAHLTFGSNSRVRGDKARGMLGWAPKGPSLMEEVERGAYREVYGKK